MLKSFCLVFALLLVLGHQLVPHMHHQEVVHADGYHAMASHPALPWWMELFSLDQGAEHLEHFRQNRESAAETADLLDIPPPLIPASILWLAPKESVQIVVSEHPFLPVARGFAAQHGLRGPPTA